MKLFLLTFLLLLLSCSDDRSIQEEEDYPHQDRDYPTPPEELPGVKK